MSTSLGIIFAIVAMLCWGFGDFLIQKSLRKIGNFETLFIIAGFGCLILLPFVWNDFSLLLLPGAGKIVLVGAGIALFIAALLEFEALRLGKLSVIEPTWSLEIPSAVLFAYLILGERLEVIQLVTIGVLIVGLFLVSYRGTAFSKKFFLEKGVTISIIAAICMGMANFFVGWGARETDPLLVNFIISFFSMIGAGVVILFKGKFMQMIRDIKSSPKSLLIMSVFDNMAWIAFAFAMTLAPIGVAAALSESYIIIAVILGIFINKEKLERHQKFGLCVAVISAILLVTQIG
jgi:drug/metabolite transporter (DMT)-like permease